MLSNYEASWKILAFLCKFSFKHLQNKEKNIKIVFKNRGVTIPKYKLDKIFEHFYRADESRGTNNGGAGLGLAITKDIIELHNGTIEAKSEDETIEFIIKLNKFGGN